MEDSPDMDNANETIPGTAAMQKHPSTRQTRPKSPILAWTDSKEITFFRFTCMSAHFVRPAMDDDAEAAVEVLRRSIMEMCVADHQNDEPTLERWLRNKTPERFRSWRSEPDNFMVVADCDSVICGVGAIRQSGDLGLCYVHPSYQGIGIGRSILTALESQVRDWGVRSIRLISTKTARNFYEHYGYMFLPDESSPGYGILFDYHYKKSMPPKAERMRTTVPPWPNL